jgi:hypothetical protein
MSLPNGRVPWRPQGIPAPQPRLSSTRTSPTRTSPRIRSTMSSPNGRALGRPQGILTPCSSISPTRTLPRIPRNPYATGASVMQKKGPVGAVTSAVTSGGTTGQLQLQGGVGLLLNMTMLSPHHLTVCPLPLLRQSLQTAQYPPCHGPPGPLPPRHLRKNTI